jgi:hypothetical protein
MMAQPSAVEVRQQKRHFAVKLSGGPLQVGCTVYMSCSLALRAPTDKRMATSVAELDLSDPSVAFVCSAEGFDVTSATSVSVNILPEKDTGSVIFELLVREANRYRITITAYQRGVIRGQLVVADPAAYMSQSVAVVEKSGETPTVHRQPPMDSEWSELATQPSLSLDLHGPDKSIVGTSPHGILDWHAKDLGPWRAEAEKVIEIARDHVSGLYADPPDPDEVDREFIVLGQQIARVIPEALAKALMDDRLKFLSLQVTAAFDFPLELCTVHKPGLDELVQDRMSVARWFTNTRAIQLNRIHQVSNIALVIGKMREDSTVETEAMDVTAPAHRSTFDTRRTLIDEVFKTRRFDLMHYFGHSGAGEQKGPQIGRYLSFARDERTLRLQDIGAVEAERAFFSRSPLIVLNCCEGIQTSALLGGPESFPHSFIDNACIACIGTIWPIDSRAGNRFMTALYEHLAKDDFLHIAVMKARRNLLDRARHRDTPADEKLYLTLAARAYVYYGPPDLRCKFVERTP